MRPCVTHHHACDCREQQVAVLIKAAQDAAVLLDEVKDQLNTLDHIDLAHSIIDRIYLASEALQDTQEVTP